VSLAEALALETEHVSRRSFDPASFKAAGQETARRGHREG
jgi:hypothetical protein